MNLAPIVLFCYNRPESTRNTLSALAENDLADQSILIIYCDGPKVSVSEIDLKLINEVRELVDKEDRFADVTVIKREENLGLAQSVIRGVTEVVNEYGSIIVLEDDIFCSKYFLTFMNESLAKYQNNSKVFSIGACNYFALGKNVPSTFAVPVADCWGWATWKNRWDLFEADSQKLISQIENKGLVNEFNLLGYYDFFGMLQSQRNGQISSWAIRWQAAIFLNNMLTVYPNPSVTQHMESPNATHANLNVLPPLAIEKIRLDDGPVRLKRRIFKKMLQAHFTGLTPNRFRSFNLSIQFAVRSMFDRKITDYVHKINSL